VRRRMNVRRIGQRLKQNRLQTFRFGDAHVRLPANDRGFGHAEETR
jgi:hypothetical protein